MGASAPRSPSLRTQARPAIEFVSGEEGLRPKSCFTVFSFLEYVFTDTLKYVVAPSSSYGAEGDGGTAPLAVTGPSVTQCVVSLLSVFPLKDVFNNLPTWAAALVAGATHGQLRMTYAAGWCLDFVAFNHEEPTEGIFLCSPFAFFLIRYVGPC